MMGLSNWKINIYKDFFLYNYVLVAHNPIPRPLYFNYLCGYYSWVSLCILTVNKIFLTKYYFKIIKFLWYIALIPFTVYHRYIPIRPVPKTYWTSMSNALYRDCISQRYKIFSEGTLENTGQFKLDHWYSQGMLKTTKHYSKTLRLLDWLWSCQQSLILNLQKCFCCLPRVSLFWTFNWENS